MQNVFSSLRLVCMVAFGMLLTDIANAAEGYMARIYTNAGTLPYRLLIPKDYKTEQRYPLIVFFHGSGERGTDNHKQLVHGTSLFIQAENRDKFPCFVFAPQCPDNQQWVDMPWGADSGIRPAQPSAAMQLALEGDRYTLKTKIPK